MQWVLANKSHTHNLQSPNNASFMIDELQSHCSGIVGLYVNLLNKIFAFRKWQRKNYTI